MYLYIEKNKHKWIVENKEKGWYKGLYVKHDDGITEGWGTYWSDEPVSSILIVSKNKIYYTLEEVFIDFPELMLL